MTECRCGIELDEIEASKPRMEFECNHNGSLTLKSFPDMSEIEIRPGDAFEITWSMSYPQDGGPPEIREVIQDEHWGISEGAGGGAHAGGGTREGAVAAADQGAREGAGPGVVVPDSFEKMVGFRGWIMTPDGELRSVAHGGHVWKTLGPEVAICQRERNGHHVSIELFRLREEAKKITDPADRSRQYDMIEAAIKRAQRSPERNCHCGIYAVHKPEYLINIVGSYKDIVYGRIKAWGKIADYEHGFRAEKAEIEALFLPAERTKRKAVRRIAKLYGARIEKPPVGLFKRSRFALR